MMHVMEVEPFRESPLFQQFDGEIRDLLFTCDPERREELEKAAEARRAARKAGKEDEDKEEDRENRPDAVYSEGFCALLQSLGIDDRSTLKRWTNGSSHLDPTRSLSLIDFTDADELEKKLEHATQEKQLSALGEDRWRLESFEFAGSKPVIARLSPTRLLLAPKAIANAVITHQNTKKAQVSPSSTQKLLSQVPHSALFYAVIPKEAAMEFKKDIGFMAATIPDPDGVIVSVLAHEYLGMFVRVNTEDATRAALLLQLAQTALDSGMMSDDPEGPAAAMIERLQLGQSKDGSDLLLTAAFDPKQLNAMLLEP